MMVRHTIRGARRCRVSQDNYRVEVRGQRSELSRYAAAIMILVSAASSWEVVAASCSQAPAGLIGWWTGDGNANDIAGTNNGSLQGGASASGTGFVDRSFSFDGTNG